MSDILIIEDDAAIRRVLTQFIEFEGYSVTAVENGKRAFEFLRESDQVPGLIFLDLNMPEMDGWEFLFAFRKEERFRNVPVVVLTAQPLDKVRPLAADVIMAKPVELDVLLGLCLEWCGRPADFRRPEFQPVG